MGSYLGEAPNPALRGLSKKDIFTGDGSTTTFDLAIAIPNVTENDIEVFVENIRQEPGTGKAYTLGFDGSSSFKRITFTAAPASGASIYVISGTETTRLLAIADDAVSTAKIQDGAITAAKIADGAIVATEIANNAVTTDKIIDDAVTADKLANSINTAIAANTAKTGITTGQANAITANTAKVTNATHTGEVTGATALTIADNIVDEANLKVSNTPVNGYVLTAQSGDTGGLTWAADSGGCWEKLNTITISGTTSQIEHEEAHYTSTYKDYKMVLSNILVSADAQMRMRVGTDGGSLGSGSNYRFGNIGRKSNGSTETQESAGASSFFMGCTSFGTSAAVFTSNFEINIYNPLSTTSYFNFYANGHHTDDNDYTAVFHCAGTYVTGHDVAIKRIALYMASGDFTGGTSTLYGRKV